MRHLFVVIFIFENNADVVQRVVKMEVFFMLLVALVFNCSQVEAQKNKEADKFDEQLWNFSTNFLLQYHSQWPLRRVVIVYHPEPGKGKIRHFICILDRNFGTCRSQN